MWVLIDISFLAHRARHAMKDLEFEDFKTGVIFGFFEQLLTICFHPKIQSNQVVLFFDSRQSYRRKAYPEYKYKRAEDRTEEEWKRIGVMKEQLNILRKEILPEIGFPCLIQTGLESDDLMAQFTLQVKTPAVMVTPDGDLYQCITDNVHWYDPARDVYLTPEAFYAKKGCYPREWGYIKSMAGCSSDNVKGIPGVGEKTALKYIDEKLPPHYKTFEAIQSEEGMEITNQNSGLVVLPHKKTRQIDIHPPGYKVERFEHHCKKFGLKSYLSGTKQEQWMNFFNGIFETRKIQIRKRGKRRVKK